MISFRKTLGALGIAGLLATATIASVVDPPSLSAASGAVASSIITIDPARILDTRSGTGLPGRIDSQTNVKLQVTGAVPTRDEGVDVVATVVPAGATGVLLNVTSVQPTARGFVSVRPGAASGVPSSSNLNVIPGQNIPNAVTVALSTDGTIDLFYGSGTAGATTDLLIDVVGYTNATAEAPATADPLQRTVIVTSGGTPAANGAALLAGIAEANAGPRSATSPWIVQLEPGVFDLGTGQAVLSDYVSLRGAGEASTTISGDRRAGGTDTAAMLEVGNASQVSDVTIRNVGTSGSGSFNVGIYVNAGDTAAIRDVTVEVDTTGGAPNPFGVTGGTNAKITIEGSTINVTASGNAVGVSGPGSISSTSSTIDIRHSTINVAGGAFAAAVSATRTTTVVEHSHLEGPNSASLEVVGTLRITNSVMIGGTFGGGTPTCLTISTGNAFLPNSCPA